MAHNFLYLRRPSATAYCRHQCLRHHCVRGRRQEIGKAGHIQKKQKINTIMAKKVNITPLHDRVIVKAAPAEEKTAGGIIIPDTAKEKPQRGTVIAAGPGKK